MSHSIEPLQYFTPQLHTFQHPAQQKSFESYQQATAKTSNSHISITTDEGDVVTFSAAYSLAQEVSGEMSVTQDGYLQSFTAASLEQNSSMLSIQGDLNEEELADIRNLMGHLNSIASSFFEGDMDEALAGAMEIGDMGSLSTLQATFRSSVAVSSQMTSYNYNPMPAAIENATHDRFAEVKELLTAERSDDLKYSDMLRAQWEQIKEFLDSAQDEGDVSLVNNDSREPDLNENPGKQMLPHIRETVAKHPRLSPFMTSLVRRSFEGLEAEEPSPAAYGLKKKLFENDFQKEFRNWLMEA